MKNEEIVLVFKVNNRHECYAHCSEAIEYFESNILNVVNENELSENIKSFLKICKKANLDDAFNFSLNTRSNGPNDKMEVSLRPGHFARTPVRIEQEEQSLVQFVNNWQINKKNMRRPHYHIRVQFDYDEVTKEYKHVDNLHFLALFLQSLNLTHLKNDEHPVFAPNALSGLVSVYLIPHTGVNCYFAEDDIDPDVSLYKIASQYLRLITKTHNGVVYASSSGGKAEALGFRERDRDLLIFPLLYLTRPAAINNQTIDNYSRVFETTGMADSGTIKNGLSYKIKSNNPRPFNDAGKEDPREAIADMLLDEARQRLLIQFAAIHPDRQKVEDINEILTLGREAIVKFIPDILNFTKNTDRFTFSIFSYLLNLRKCTEKEANAKIRKTVQETSKFAMELGEGIRQIVQNAIQHSQNRECFISIFKEIYKNDECLAVRISDLNEKMGIIETFRQTLTTENKINVFDRPEVNLSLNQLVGDFSDSPAPVLNAWYNYRKKDSSGHIGLTMFYHTLKKCNYHCLEIISNPAHRLANNKNNYYASNSTGEQRHGQNFTIPGTHFYFTIPTNYYEKMGPVNLVQLANNNAFNENHLAFSKYLDYKVSNKMWENESVKLRSSDSQFYSWDIKSFEDKKKTVEDFKNFWLNLLNPIQKDHKTLYWCDVKNDEKRILFEKLKNPTICEVFLKGFFAAASLSVHKTQDNDPLLFYFENLPVSFINTLQSVSVPLSLLDYPTNLQVFFSCESNEKSIYPNQAILAGNNVGHVVQNAYIMSLEHGEKSFDSSHYRNASDILALYRSMLAMPETAIPICPFTVFEYPENKDKLPQFYKSILNIANKDLVSPSKEEPGYLFRNIHVRLGNKVHANSFYEMSFLFHRTSIANRIAFYIIRKLESESILTRIAEKGERDIVFYGYASYSQSLVFSLHEMLTEYFKNRAGVNIYYASYQYNIQSESKSDQTPIQIYSTRKNSDSGKPTAVIQIVPIASTLTTFDKMWAQYSKERKNEYPHLTANYTVFLIRDKINISSAHHTLPIPPNGDLFTIKDDGTTAMPDDITPIENELWKSIDTSNRTVTVDTAKLVELKDCKKISYIFSAMSSWSKPINCKQCFPDKVWDEIPLIETDRTSTVPAFQFYQIETSENKASPIEETGSDLDGIKVKFEELKDCVYYGHIVRGANHYQYYFDTQKYIARPKIQQLVIKWLTDEREKDTKRRQEEKNGTPVLNIIFAPEHNTNAGFSQLVNAHYFNGAAEIVSINVHKQFRSNFVCEHYALNQTIERLFSEKFAVKFYFVDDGIITGESFQRANSLSLSLLPKEQRDSYTIGSKQRNIFEKVFCLINRLSDKSKEAYVAWQENNFLSFCNIHISNMRTQGDSCVGCKFEEEAKYLLKRSSTKTFADYWKKKTDDYKPISFDTTKEMNKHSGNKAFVRFIINHAAETIIKKYGQDYKKALIEFLNIILNTSDEFEANDEESILVKVAYESMEEVNTGSEKTIWLIQNAIKVISRPFLSYNFELRKEVYKLLICMSEAIISDEVINNEYKEIIKSVKHLFTCECPESESILTFLKDFLFESLSDMRSNYLLREHVIKSVYLYILNHNSNDKTIIRNFWNKYAFLIHYIIDSGGDETRSLWMEHLFSHGTEYVLNRNDNKQPQKGKSLPLFDAIVSSEKNYSDMRYSWKKEIFKEFCMEIFIQNTRLIFDGIYKLPNEQGTQSNTNYFLQTFAKFREWNFSWAGVPNNGLCATERKLFDLIKTEGHNTKNTLKKYELILLRIKRTISEKYDIEKNTMRLAIVVQNKSDKIDMDHLDFISVDFRENPPHSPSDAKYIIKQRIIMASEDEYKQNSNCSMHGNLKQDGYVVITAENKDGSETPDKFDQEADNNSFKKPFVIIRFDKEEIENVYLYIRFDFKNDSSKSNVIPFLVLRDILTYRNLIITMFKDDFNSHLMQTHAKTASENAVLRHEKSVSHTSTSDDQLSAVIWNKAEKTDAFDKYGPFDKYVWLLFRNYINHEIAKIFNQSLLYQENEQNDNHKPRLYLEEADIDNTDSFAQKAERFCDIWDENDKRVRMCKAFTEVSDITDIKDSLIRSGKCGSFVKEYLKCILFDIILTGAKYWHENVDFLTRIQKLIKIKEQFSKICREYDINNCNEREKDAIKSYGVLIYRVLFMRDGRNLIIINPVNPVYNNILNTDKQQNEKIYRRLTDTLDCFDGHMSLLAISKYLKNNPYKDDFGKNTSKKSTSENKWFEYKSSSELNENYQNGLKTLFGYYFDKVELWFVSTLPLFDS
ncbi:MAG: hypothetical protein LBD44_01175 [Spirochaetaceae bacterium]|jgi:hypothetical protein|nr:hypothetical protein [Spirochaetaceae bacterium]